jgi:hypothetical protein
MQKAEAIIVIRDARDDSVQPLPPPRAATIVDESLGEAIHECVGVVVVQHSQRRVSRS